MDVQRARMADRVLLICDERYAQLADHRHGGVGWEAMVIQGDMYREMTSRGRSAAGDADTSKYIPVVPHHRFGVRTPRLHAGRKLWIHGPPQADDATKGRELLEELPSAARTTLCEKSAGS